MLCASSDANMATQSAGQLTLGKFALKKQASMDVLVNAMINGVVRYFLLSGVARVPIRSASVEALVSFDPRARRSSGRVSGRVATGIAMIERIRSPRALSESMLW
jgi:hypothetical protein